jgi:hypothetical protein
MSSGEKARYPLKERSLSFFSSSEDDDDVLPSGVV